METPVVKGDGKIILSFKDNQCVVETEYTPPPPLPPPHTLSREPQLPFHQTILAGNPQSQSWLTGLIVLQGISMIVGVLIMIGIGVYLVNRSQDSHEQFLKTQVQLENQQGTIERLEAELSRLSAELKHFRIAEKKEELERLERDVSPLIETNTAP